MDNKDELMYLAIFNLSDEVKTIEVAADDLELESFSNKSLEELWTGEVIYCDKEILTQEILPHGAKLFKIG